MRPRPVTWLYAGLAIEGGEEGTRSWRAPRQQRLVYATEDAQRAGADGGAAAEGGAVRAESEDRSSLRGRRLWAGRRPGRGHNVRREAVLHPGVEAARAAVAGLHLVADQEDILFRRELRPCNPLKARSAA